MAMGKQKSSKSTTFVRGGKTKMFGKQSAGPQKPGTTAATKSGSGGKFAKGGGKKMFGFTGAKPSKPGVTK